MKGEQQSNQLQQQKQQQDTGDVYVAPTHQYNEENYMKIEPSKRLMGHHPSAMDFWHREQHASGGQQASALRASDASAATAKAIGGLPVSGNQTAEYCQQPQQKYDSYQPIYSDDNDDVWCSEERLFEEIFNKWRLLDDDIWCKLIIMERNRRIGKAYARVPIVTIDGSPELSYDGYKLALNGFDNPHRDSKTEEYRKRIGKGIRIKMDNFGNILIKRLTKAGVFIKGLIDSGTLSSIKLNKGGRGVMPSRQQLIKNHCSQHGLFNNNNNRLLGNTIQPIYSTNSVEPTSPAAGCDALEMLQNETSICDEIIDICGRLEQDKIYVIFDMKKFQANISRELCYPYPNKRKLERQCFSIIGLVRDATDILSLPCWVMVINIVAIEMLNERFSQAATSDYNLHTSFPDTMLMDRHLGQDGSSIRNQSSQNYTTIYSNNSSSSSSSSGINTDSNNIKSLRSDKKSISADSKLEDPYTLPASASSSDIKSSTDDYATSLCKSRVTPIDSNYDLQRGAAIRDPPPDYYGGVGESTKITADRSNSLLRKGGSAFNANGGNISRRSRSSCNIRSDSRGIGAAKLGDTQIRSRFDKSCGGGGGSIYSPGHMLLQTARGNNPVPPKLPPRDFSSAKKTYVSKFLANSTSNSGPVMEPPIDYGSNYDFSEPAQSVASSNNLLQNKARQNKFLDVQRGPAVEMTTSCHRSKSAVGHYQSPSSNLSATGDSGVIVDSKGDSGSSSCSRSNSNKGTKSAKVSSISSIRSNIKLFLTSGSSSKSSGSSAKIDGSKSSRDRVSDNNSDYVHAGEKNKLEGSKNYNNNEQEDDSVVDSTGILDDSAAAAASACNQVVASRGRNWLLNERYKELDIPTPDYEIDVDNNYAVGHEASFRRFTSLSMAKNEANQHYRSITMLKDCGKASKHRSSRNGKDDLYHSGFRAHIPQNIDVARSGRANKTENHLAPDIEFASNACLNKGDNYAGNNKSARNFHHGSSTLGSSRYRSASVQRYPTTIAPKSYHHRQSEAINNLGDPMLEHRRDYSSLYGTNQKLPTSSRASNNNFDTSSTMIRNQAQCGVANAKLLNNSYHTIGRSSSGIYNSSSSSSDYVDWNPQMRKFNSSGYLNSIKSHSSLQNRQNLVRLMTNPLDNRSSHCINKEINNHRTSMAYDNYMNSLSRESRSNPTGRNRPISSSTLLRQSSQKLLMNNSSAAAADSSYRSTLDVHKDEISESPFMFATRWLMA